MTAPGWYKAEGDAADSLRYWDGNAWVGDAVPSAQTQVPNTAGGYELKAPTDTFQRSYGDPARDHTTATIASQPAVKHVVDMDFDTGLTVLAIIIAVLKAIPLAIGALALRSVVDAGRDLDRAVGTDNAQLIRDAENTVYVVLAILALPLVIQLFAAFAKRPIILFSVAVVLTSIDVVAVIGYATGSLIMLILALGMVVAQASLALWAFTIIRSRRAATRANRVGSSAS